MVPPDSWSRLPHLPPQLFPPVELGSAADLLLSSSALSAPAVCSSIYTFTSPHARIAHRTPHIDLDSRPALARYMPISQTGIL